jgi:hypothetical protein
MLSALSLATCVGRLLARRRFGHQITSDKKEFGSEPHEMMVNARCAPVRQLSHEHAAGEVWPPEGAAEPHAPDRRLRPELFALAPISFSC